MPSRHGRVHLGCARLVDMEKLVLREIDLRSTIAYVRDPAVIRVVVESTVDLKPFITSRIALEDLVEQGFDTPRQPKDTAVKVLVHRRFWWAGAWKDDGGRRTPPSSFHACPWSGNQPKVYEDSAITSQHWRRNTEALDQDRFCQWVHVRRFTHYAHNARFGGL